MMNWIDSRVKKPTSNHFDGYFVTFLYCGSTFLGFADWMPKNGYTDGDWQNVRCTNGNPLGGDVLCWLPHPKLPAINDKWEEEVQRVKRRMKSILQLERERDDYKQGLEAIVASGCYHCSDGARATLEKYRKDKA